MFTTDFLTAKTEIKSFSTDFQEFPFAIMASIGATHSRRPFQQSFLTFTWFTRLSSEHLVRVAAELLQ